MATTVDQKSLYEPLSKDCIRVLVLQPGSAGEPLIGTLEPVSLERSTSLGATGGSVTEQLTYEAISYAWGDVILPRSLELIDRGHLHLTESLYTALQALRSRDKPRRLWADALCINQEDVDERSSQVAMMGSIYSSAEKVLVWLGPCSVPDIETLAFTTLAAPVTTRSNEPRRKLLRTLARHIEKAKHCACCGAKIPGGRPVRLEDGLAAVAKLLERPYFERLWIVQEVALGTQVEIHCGSHSCPWEVFTEVAKAPGKLEVEHEYSSTLVPNTLPRGKLRALWARCNYLNQLRARNETARYKTESASNFRPTQLCKDLLMLSHLKCRDPHDRIFGVSRVLGLDKLDSLKVDYSISVAELYRRTIALFLTAPANRSGGRAVQALALAGTECSEATPLVRPSWVPHLQYLSDRSRAKYSYYGWTLTDPQHLADGNNFRCKIHSGQPQILQVRGRHFANILTICEDSGCPSKHVERRSGHKCPQDEGVALIQWHQRCRQFLLAFDALRDQERLSSASNGLEKLLQGVFACDPEHRFRAEMPQVLPEIVQSWLSASESTGPKTSIKLVKLVEDLQPYITGHPVDRDRNLCIVEGVSGLYAAWIPKTARPGDCVYYIAGAPYPFILRPTADDSFQLLGDAFVEGASKPQYLGIDISLWQSLMYSSAEDQPQSGTQPVAKEGATIKADRYATAHPKEYRQDDQNHVQERQAWLNEIEGVCRRAHEDMEWIRIS